MALAADGLSPLVDRRTELSIKFITKAKELEPLRSVIPTRSIVSHDYSLRSGTQRSEIWKYRTVRMNNFCTVRYA